jgi:hypothetical protein
MCPRTEEGTMKYHSVQIVAILVTVAACSDPTVEDGTTVTNDDAIIAAAPGCCTMFGIPVPGVTEKQCHGSDGIFTFPWKPGSCGDVVACCALDGKVNPTGRKACAALGGLSYGILLCGTDEVCCYSSVGLPSMTTAQQCFDKGGEVNPAAPGQCM